MHAVGLQITCIYHMYVQHNACVCNMHGTYMHEKCPKSMHITIWTHTSEKGKFQIRHIHYNYSVHILVKDLYFEIWLQSSRLENKVLSTWYLRTSVYIVL